MKKIFSASTLLAMSLHVQAATYDATSAFDSIQLLTTFGAPTSSYGEWAFGYADFSKYSFAPYTFFNGHRTSEDGYNSNFTWALSSTTNAGYPPMTWIYEGDRAFQGIQPGTLILQPARPTLSYNASHGELEVLSQGSPVIRFTTPETGNYFVTAAASPAGINQRVVMASSYSTAPFFDQIITNSGLAVSFTVSLQRGQTIDLIGVSTLSTSDNTYIPISLVITSVPEPSSFWSAISGIVLIGGFALIRRGTWSIVQSNLATTRT